MADAIETSGSPSVKQEKSKGEPPCELEIVFAPEKLATPKERIKSLLEKLKREQKREQTIADFMEAPNRSGGDFFLVVIKKGKHVFLLLKIVENIWEAEKHIFISKISVLKIVVTLEKSDEELKKSLEQAIADFKSEK